MKAYKVRRRQDGAIEVVPHGAKEALLLFESAEDLLRFLNGTAAQIDPSVLSGTFSHIVDPALRTSETKKG